MRDFIGRAREPAHRQFAASVPAVSNLAIAGLSTGFPQPVHRVVNRFIHVPSTIFRPAPKRLSRCLAVVGALRRLELFGGYREHREQGRVPVDLGRLTAACIAVSHFKVRFGNVPFP